MLALLVVGSLATAGCPGNHALQRFRTPLPKFRCDLCGTVQARGSAMWGCRTCDWDMCATCEKFLRPVPIGELASDDITACPTFETQAEAFCGLHAVRNILAAAGYPVSELPTRESMNAICEGLVGEGLAENMDEVRTEKGNYAHPVLAKSLEMHGVVMGEGQDISLVGHAWMVNTGANGHWFAYVQSKGNWWNVDSLNGNGPRYIKDMTAKIIEEKFTNGRTVFRVQYTAQLIDKVGPQILSMLS